MNAQRLGFTAAITLLLCSAAPAWAAKIRCPKDADMVANVRAVQAGEKAAKREWGSLAPIFCVVGSTALSVQEKILAARTLAEMHSDLAFRNAAGETALHVVAKSGPAELAKLLIDNGADPDAMNLEGVSPQQLAMKSGDPALINVFAASSRYVDNRDNRGLTSLYEAASRGDLAVVKQLVARGADAGLSDKNALTGAAINGHAGVVRYLIEEVKLPVDVRSSDGETALMGAAAANQLPLARLLIEEHHADPQLASPRGRTALSLAATAGHLDMIRYLKAHGASDTASTPSALSIAALARRPDVVKLLIELGADLGAGTAQRPGALFWAGVSGDVEVLTALTDHRVAYPSFPDSAGPLVRAVVNRYYGRGLLAQGQYAQAMPYLRDAVSGYDALDNSLSDRIVELRKTASRETVKANLMIGFAMAFGAYAAQYQAAQYENSMAQIQAMGYANQAGTGVAGYYQYYDSIMRASTIAATSGPNVNYSYDPGQAATSASADMGLGSQVGWRGRAAIARSEADSLRDLVERYRDDSKLTKDMLDCATATLAPGAAAPAGHCI